MSVDAHRLAAEAMVRAESHLRAGDEATARKSFLEAADLEIKALSTIPRDRVRTRAIIGLSAASLYMRALQDDAAVRIAADFLATSELPVDIRRDFIDLLVSAERHRELSPGKRTDAGDLFEVILRGEDVLVGGVVRLETALLKMQQFQHYLLRVGEYVLNRPFRPRGTSLDESAHGFIPIIGPAAVGSYRFELGVVVAPEQLQLQQPSPGDPERIGAEAFGILEATIEAPERLSERIDDPHYREWFTKAVRNLAPTGRGLAEVEIVRRRTRDSALLVPESHRRLSRQIRSMRPARLAAGEEQEDTISGVLRALNLDDHWLKIVQGNQEIRCRIGQGVFDDVVGPYVNHKVVLSVIHGRGLAPEVLDITEASE